MEIFGILWFITIRDIMLSGAGGSCAEQIKERNRNNITPTMKKTAFCAVQESYLLEYSDILTQRST